jgi:FAD/FMN-containing dehydrogenase
MADHTAGLFGPARAGLFLTRMTLRPSSVDELAKAFADLAPRGTRVTAVDLSALHQVLEYTPEDMTVTVQAGITLATLQSRLAERGQWLPIDPPHPESTTIAALLAYDLSGPRRLGFGTIREHLLGLKVVLAEGRVIRNGGKVVKNVAGFDLCKLFVGDRGTLGVVVEATFKVLPRPEQETFRAASFGSLPEAESLIEAVLESDVTPVLFDLHNLASQLSLVVGFAGAKEDVEWQTAKARALGISEAVDLNYQERFWSENLPTPARLSILPARLVESIRQLGSVNFVARAGNGIVYYRGAPSPPVERPLELTRRVKAAFDPKGILPDLSP